MNEPGSKNYNNIEENQLERITYYRKRALKKNKRIQKYTVEKNAY